MPASISSPMRSGVDEAGPSVQTIFARGMTPRSRAQVHTAAAVTACGNQSSIGLEQESCVRRSTRVVTFAALAAAAFAPLGWAQPAEPPPNPDANPDAG